MSLPAVCLPGVSQWWHVPDGAQAAASQAVAARDAAQAAAAAERQAAEERHASERRTADECIMLRRALDQAMAQV